MVLFGVGFFLKKCTKKLPEIFRVVAELQIMTRYILKKQLIRDISFQHTAFLLLHTLVLRSTSAGMCPANSKKGKTYQNSNPNVFSKRCYWENPMYSATVISCRFPHQRCQDGASDPSTEPTLHRGVVGNQLQPHALKIKHVWWR